MMGELDPEANANQRSPDPSAIYAAVSHELRTPMTVILGNASVLATRMKNDLSDAESKRAVADIEVELDRLNSIITDLITLTRFDHGLVLEKTQLPVGRLVDQVTGAFLGPNKRDVSIAGTREAVIEGDESCLSSLLTNLLSNAHKYSPPDSPIEVTIEVPPGECRIGVLDRGIGIPPDEPEQLFHAFYRSERVRDSIRGLGLGLTVCKKVAEAHGGRIWAEPRPGGGSQFLFTLPTVGRSWAPERRVAES